MRPLLALLLTLSMPASVLASHGHKPRHHRPHKHVPAPDSCAVPHKQVLAVDAQAQVYVLRSGVGQRMIFGCAKGAKRSFSLGPSPACQSPNDCVGVESFALAGTVVAFGSVTIAEPIVPGEAAQRRFLVQVRDLSTNRILHIAPTGLPATPTPGLTGVGRARAIVVTEDGAVAWVAQDETDAVPGVYEVGADDAGGLRLLAAGPDIDPSSLTLTGSTSTVHWSQAGQSASAALN
jgi:hypothetical protein